MVQIYTRRKTQFSTIFPIFSKKTGKTKTGTANR
jgi:hypothetical protein